MFCGLLILWGEYRDVHLEDVDCATNYSKPHLLSDDWWLREGLKALEQTGDSYPPSASLGRQSGFSGGMKRSGLWMVTVQFVFGSPLVTELRSEPKVKTHGEGQGSEDRHTQGRKEGKRQWELVWRNGLNKQSLQSPAPYYPIIYTAWELGKRGLLKTTVGFPLKSGILRLTPIKKPGIIVPDRFWVLLGLMCLFSISQGNDCISRKQYLQKYPAFWSIQQQSIHLIT